jgi:uncharacterized protein
MLPLRLEMRGVPPSWSPYFGVEDVGSAEAKVSELGGRTLFGPQQVPSGAFITVMDPQGAVCNFSAGEYDD